MELKKVLSGISHYIEKHLYARMTSWQVIVARVAVARAMRTVESFAGALASNALVTSLGFMDHDGHVDVDGIMDDLRAAIEQTGELSFDIPMYGKLTFHAQDIHDMHRCIMEHSSHGEYHHHDNAILRPN
jgi:hypothetical protein